MKKIVGIATLAAMIAVSCGNNSNKQHATEAIDSISQAPEGTETVELGKMNVTWIQDNSAERLMERTLFADASDSLIDSLGLQNGVPATISTFMLEAKGCQVLFDTGNGAPDSRLIASMDSLGIEPAEINYIYLTHLHGDHIGGMMAGDSAVFVNAEVYLSKAEYNAWMKDMPSDKNGMQKKTLDAYKERLHLFEFGDTLPCGVVAMNAAGHTPGHTAYEIGELLIVGDLMHGAALQTVHPEICAAYDMDKEQAVKTRKYFLNYAKENRKLMAGMHLPAPAFIDYRAK